MHKLELIEQMNKYSFEVRSVGQLGRLDGMYKVDFSIHPVIEAIDRYAEAKANEARIEEAGYWHSATKYQQIPTTLESLGGRLEKRIAQLQTQQSTNDKEGV